MWQTKWNFSKDFEVRLYDAIAHVLSIQDASRTTEQIRFVMEDEELSTEEEQCFKEVISTFEKAKQEEGEDYEHIELDIIKEHLLSVPTLVFEDCFEKFRKIYDDKEAEEKKLQGYGDNIRSVYYAISETMGNLENMFFYIGRAVRFELGESVKEEFARMFQHTEEEPQNTDADPSANMGIRTAQGEEPDFNFKPVEVEGSRVDPDEEPNFDFDPIM